VFSVGALVDHALAETVLRGKVNFGISRPAIPLTGEHVQYNARGYPEQLRDVYRTSATVPGQIYRATTAVDARGNVVEEVFANNSNMTVFRGYAENSGWLTQIKSGAQSNGLTSPTFGALQDLVYSYDLQGNVMSRSDRSASATTNEAFRYDRLQRLTGTVRNGISESMGYFSSGNISSKYNLSGSYAYDRQAPSECSAVLGNATPGPFALTKIGSAESFCYDSRGNQIASFAGGILKREISYTSFDAARVIRSNSPRSFVTRFNYGAARQRLRRYDFAGSVTTESSQGKVTHYAGDAEVTTKPDGSTEVRRYISGMMQVQQIPATGVVQLRREYLMTDALGSTHRVVSEQAAIIPDGKQAFATFGERANDDDRSTLSEVAQANYNAALPRGYTGHQQADEVGVIHMNGRIYDPRLGRFLQADPLMEDIFDPQAINAYSYVRNNPMNATDPTGYWRDKEKNIFRQVAAIAITIATGINVQALILEKAATATIMTHLAVGGALSGGISSGTLKGALIGALSAMTFHKIGITELGDTERVFAHALAGGTLEVLGGGSFGHGFISAGLGKALSPLANVGDPIGNGVMNAIIGGTVSEVTGGDFANGAQMAAMQYAFNQIAQSVVNNATPIPLQELNNPKSLRESVRGLNEQLKMHEEKLRDYRERPLSNNNDNKGHLRKALSMREPGRFLKIYNERVYELNRQIQQYKLQIDMRLNQLIKLGEIPQPRSEQTGKKMPTSVIARGVFGVFGIFAPSNLSSCQDYSCANRDRASMIERINSED
jgi:RHS repeat-associated protein